MRVLSMCFFTVFVCCLPLGCGDDADSSDPLLINAPNSTGPDGGNGQSPSVGSLSPVLGLVLPSAGMGTARELMEVGTYGVVIASQSVGGARAVTSGTLTFEGQTPSYSPQPSDALIIVIDDVRYRYVVRTFAMSADADSLEAIFSEPHQIELEVSVQGTALSLSLASQSNGDGWQFDADGAIEHQELGALTLDLRQRNATQTDIGTNQGVEYDSGSVLEGTVRSTNGRFLTDVNERSLYVSVALDSIAEERHHYVEQRITLDGRTYTTQNMYLRSAFLDGCPNDEDFWLGEGRMLLGGEVLGQVGLVKAPGGFTFVFSINGQDLVLEAYPFCP